ncbi:peptidase [Pseudomonas fluorescens]|uniref:peptidase n=1 Tax=Pseudomonas fluorescens TaxID=294 RepID=UPI000ABA743D|nr:peptidase [Pseudomonas fluorescens]
MNRLMMKLMGHALMNEATADGATSGGSTPAPAAAPAPASASESTMLTPPAAPAATDPKPEGDPAKPEDPAKTNEDKPKDEKADEPKGAPEAYGEFKLAEGMELDAEVLGEFTGLAKELNISQEAAQKLIDLQSKIANKQAQEYQAAVEKQKEQWMAAVKNDPELGGENFDKSVASAVKVIQAFGSPELREVLTATGLGNNPEMFKFVHRISQAISEDKLVLPGSQTPAPKEMSIIDAFK